MPLKDLVADRGKITEEIIERIVDDYVRYDPKSYEIVFTPKGVALNNDCKILVYLAAALGWRYVVDDEKSTDTKPANLEAVLGIPGGTLRPVLKKLKDAHLLAVADGHYSVRIANLDAIERAVTAEKTVTPNRRSTRKTKGNSAPTSADFQPVEVVEKDKKRRSTVPNTLSLSNLFEQGYFKEYRTLSQVVGRLHEQAIIAKSTSLSGPIADLVRRGKLERKKIDEGGKQVWGYKAI
jgi:hypothetical protein